MPYRDGIDSVLQRCEELRAEIERIEECAIDPPELESLAQALAWEAALHIRLDHLAVRARDSGAMVSVSGASGSVPALHHARGPVAIGALFVLVTSTVLFGVSAYMENREPATETPPPTRSYLFAGDVVSGAHRGDRCEITIDVDHATCDLDVICPTVERRIRATCNDALQAKAPAQLDLDGRRGHLVITDETSRPLQIQLDAWR